MKSIAFAAFSFLLITGMLMAIPKHKSSKRKKVKFPYGNWMRSQEEDKDPNSTWLLYRPDAYDFPPARGRSGFSLLKDGTFSLIQPSAVDGRETKAGTWTMVSAELFQIKVPGSSLTELRWKRKGKDLLEVEMK